MDQRRVRVQDAPAVPARTASARVGIPLAQDPRGIPSARVAASQVEGLEAPAKPHASALAGILRASEGRSSSNTSARTSSQLGENSSPSNPWGVRLEIPPKTAGRAAAGRAGGGRLEGGVAFSPTLSTSGDLTPPGGDPRYPGMHPRALLEDEESAPAPRTPAPETLDEESSTDSDQPEHARSNGAHAPSHATSPQHAPPQPQGGFAGGVAARGERGEVERGDMGPPVGGFEPEEDEDEPSQAAPHRPPPQPEHEEHNDQARGRPDEPRARRRGEAARSPANNMRGQLSSGRDSGRDNGRDGGRDDGRDGRRDSGSGHGLRLPGEKEDIVFPGDKVGDERAGRGGGGMMFVDARNKAALLQRIEGLRHENAEMEELLELLPAVQAWGDDLEKEASSLRSALKRTQVRSPSCP
ncbi:hypothetical protein T484DRAFT_1893837 [Baffinella frigidus]|nr:hypothetical protein T484DRAFT_1893837 [Cryptophyta sp. CCMP2293]